MSKEKLEKEINKIGDDSMKTKMLTWLSTVRNTQLSSSVIMEDFDRITAIYNLIVNENTLQNTKSKMIEWFYNTALSEITMEEYRKERNKYRGSTEN